MTHRHKTRMILASLTATALGAAAPAALAGPSQGPASGGASGCQPTITALPLPTGDTNGDILANAGPFAAGFVADDAQHQSVAVWRRSGGSWTVRDLGDFGISGLSSGLSATGVNIRGEVALGVNADTMAGWVFTGGSAHQLKDFAGGTLAFARAINAHGVVAGEALDAQGNDFAAVWPHWWSAPVRLGPVPGYDGSFGQGIDDRGDVTGGSFSFGALPQVAVRWDPSGHPTTLPGLGGNADGFAVQASGKVVGEARTSSGTNLAVVWRAGGGVHSLGLFTGAQFSKALDVNSNGVVVGFEGANPAPPAIPRRQILLWQGDGPVRSLLPLSLNWNDGAYSHSLNDRGDVFGASSAGAFPRPTVWTCALAQSFVPPTSGSPMPTVLPTLISTAP